MIVVGWKIKKKTSIDTECITLWFCFFFYDEIDVAVPNKNRKRYFAAHRLCIRSMCDLYINGCSLLIIRRIGAIDDGAFVYTVLVYCTVE